MGDWKNRPVRTSYLGASMPFYDKQGKLQGVLLTNINLSKDKNQD
jgi:two-component system sensor histidine kinase ChiS